MGMLIEGKWSTRWYEPDEKGRFLRSETQFRDRITADGSSGLPAVAGRYHLYVSLACPWAHRTLILRKLKGLEQAISLAVVDPLMTDDGWHFSDGPGCIPDPVLGKPFLREVYLAAQNDYTGRVTVPILWDKERGTIINNESREIMRMLDTEMDAVGDASVGFYPEAMRDAIDATIDAIYEPFNNGVYRAGFATTQQAYDEAVADVFASLDRWERVLASQRYLCGDVITEADWCMFTTLLRFDPVYHGHFKCNLRRIVDYPHLSGYLRDLYQVPGIAETCNLDHIKQHYYRSHTSINPTQVVPSGPLLDLTAAHDRARLG